METRSGTERRLEFTDGTMDHHHSLCLTALHVNTLWGSKPQNLFWFSLGRLVQILWKLRSGFPETQHILLPLQVTPWQMGFQILGLSSRMRK